MEQEVSTTASVEQKLSFWYGKAGDWHRRTRTRATVFLASDLTTPIADTGYLDPGLSPSGTDRTDLFPSPPLTFTPSEGNIVIRFTETAANRTFALLDNVVLTVNNMAPTAEAGADQSIREGDMVNLDGNASFDDNTATGALLYNWNFVSQPAGSSATLVDPTSAAPSFVADVFGNYVVELLVTDEGGLSNADEVEVSSDNLAPTADAGDDQLVITGNLVMLDGTGSFDPESDLLSYSWVITAAPLGSNATLSDTATSNPTLIPDLDGAYEVSLTGSDFLGAGSTDITEITATTASGFAENRIMNAADIVSALDPSQVTNRGNKNRMLKVLSKALNKIQKGKPEKAIKKLQKVIKRTNGCEANGAPDGKGGGERDYITDCDAQAAIMSSLNEALSALAP